MIKDPTTFICVATLPCERLVSASRYHHELSGESCHARLSRLKYLPEIPYDNNSNFCGAVIISKAIARVHSVHLKMQTERRGGGAADPQIKPIDELRVRRKLAVTVHIRHGYFVLGLLLSR